jgi:hypothetical protein
MINPRSYNMKLKFYLLTLLLPAFAIAQLSNADFDSVYDRLSQQSHETGYIGNKNGLPNTFEENFKRTAQILSDDDLTYICQNANPVLKATALQELVGRKSNRLSEMFQLQLASNDKVTIYTGGLSADYALSAALYKALAHEKEKLERKAYYEKTSTQAQLAGLKELFGADYDSRWTIKETDSLMRAFTALVLSKDNMPAETLSQIFRTNGFKDSNYKRVKYFAGKYPTPEILATLATFKNSNDLPLFHKNVGNGYLAISRFPHPSFLPELKSKLDEDYDKPEFQEAVAAYRSRESKTILETICKKITMTNREGFSKDESLFRLHGIIEQINCPIYSDLLLRLEKTI